MTTCAVCGCALTNEGGHEPDPALPDDEAPPDLAAQFGAYIDAAWGGAEAGDDE